MKSGTMPASHPEQFRQWSHSRAQTMATCQRQFFFQYCADAHWEHPDPRLRDLFLLKRLKAIAMWKGDVVHQTLAEYFRRLRDSRPLPYGGLAGKAEGLARMQWEFSESRRYRRQGKSSGGQAFAALFEHEYDIEDAESIDDALKHIRTCLSNFQSLDTAHNISRAFCAGRDHLVEPPAWGDGATTFAIAGIKVIVKVDLAFATQDGRYLIFDWKTGKGDEDARAQLELYALWAHLSLGYPLDSISAHEVSLFRGSLSCYQMTEASKFYRLEQIRRSSDLIHALMRPDGDSPAQLQDFSYARQVSTCRRCALQRVCKEFP